jgi:hypothetical protein
MLYYKIDGCDLMFCTGCKTSFHWKTLRITTTEVHNPHYFEWLLSRNQTHENIIGQHENTDVSFMIDRRCERILDENFLVSFITNVCTQSRHFDLLRKCRWINHIRNIEINNYRQNPDDDLILRIKFLIKDISETKFKKLIQMRHKKYEKYAEYENIMNMFTNCYTDIMYKILYKMLQKKPSKSFVHKDKYTKHKHRHRLLVEQKDLTEFICEGNALLLYVNNCLYDISVAYGCKCIHFDESLILCT